MKIGTAANSRSSRCSFPLVGYPRVGLRRRDRAVLAADLGQAGEDRQERAVGEHSRVHLHRHVAEAGVQQQVAVLAGGPRRGHLVGAPGHDGAGQLRVAGVGHERVPVLPAHDDAAARGQHRAAPRRAPVAGQPARG